MINSADNFEYLEEGPVYEPHDERVDEIPPERIEPLTHTLSRFFAPGEQIEIRCIQTVGNQHMVVSGGFTDPEEASIWALAAEIDWNFSVYFGLNPRAKKQPSRELSFGAAYSRKHVARLRWLLVDFDPVREGGCSTAAEKQHAHELMARVSQALCDDHGWPAPIMGDSGNGYHLLFRIDLPCEERPLITSALQALSDQFSIPEVVIDAGVDNVAQLTRLYGTLNRKGDNTDERPWRYSEAFPGGGDEIVTDEQLRLFASAYPPKRNKAKRQRQKRQKQNSVLSGQRYDVPAILNQCGLAYTHKKMETDEGEGDVYELSECPWSEEHSTGPGGSCVMQFPNGAVSFKCHHDSCRDRAWNDFKKLYDIRMRKAKTEQGGELELGATYTAERHNRSRGEDCPEMTADNILDKFRQEARTHPKTTDDNWKAYYRLGESAIIGHGLSVEEAVEIIESDYVSRCQSQIARDDLETILERFVRSAAANPDNVGKAVLHPKEDEDDKRRSEADRLLAFVRDRAELWHDSLRDGFATIPVGDHQETYAIMSDAFEDWLVPAWLDETGGAPKNKVREDSRDLLQCLARAKGERYEAPVRIATTEEAQTIWLDLVDEKWRAVKITAQGWSVEDHVPVRFVRYPASEPLPEPVLGGNIEELKPFVSVVPEDWPLVLVWLVGCFLPRGTYPVMQASGRQGSGKTTMQEALRKLVDPRTVKAPVGVPKDQDQLILAARSSFIAAYNNVSYVDNAQSDWLCCLVEGTAINKRTLYTTAGETILSLKRPVLINGIGSSSVRGDLFDRSLLVAVEPPAERKTEEELWTDFEEARPRILGALLSAVSTALARVEEITIPEPRPRLLDLVRFATAAEPALGLEDGAVLRSTRQNKQEASERAVEAVAWVPALRLLLQNENGEWKGTSSELLQALQEEETRPPRNRRGNCADWPRWPKGAQPLSNALARLAPDLEVMGIHCESGKTHGQRWLRLTLECDE